MNSIKLVLAAAFAAVIGASYAVEVSGDTASKAARNWVRRGGLLGARMGYSVERADRHVTDSGSAFYTVRMAGGGTVITSADTDDEPIVAFTSETNDLSTIEKDSPLWALLNRRFKKSAGTSRSRLRLSTSSVTAEESDAAKRWGSLTNAPNRLSLKVSSTYIDGTENTVGDLRVPKLTTSKWNQASGGGYKAWNYYTPNNYLCGCVATAMAQIMYCHRWPAESPQNKTYKCYSDGNAVYLTTKGGAYDWDSMVDQPKKPSFTEAQAMAMSKLTYDCGVSVRMSYYDSASAAFDHYSVNQFKNLFGYASATYFDCYNGERRGYGTEAYLLTNNIERVLFSNFDAGYPVMLGIDGPTGGHEIVGDGYGYNDGLPYVHLNIGFGGGTDFWYLLPDMNGGSQSNFSMVDDVIYNIIPGTEQNLAVFSGRVKNADGTGIAGVTVSIREVQGGTTTQIATATANAYGVYGTSFVPKAGATYYAAVSGVSGYADGRSAAVGVSAPKVTTEIMGYEEDIERLVFKGADVGNSWGNDITLTAASSGPDYLDVIVAPMVKSKWSQLYAGGNINSGDPCYNYYTPGHTHCGCCPTAIAQIMRYHEWPKTAVRTDYFVDSYNEILGTYHVTTTAAYPCKYNDVATNMVMKGGVYDWSKMPYETRTSGTPEEQREMIGRLCHDVGVSMSTFYKGAGTGSSSPVVAHSLPGNFHYADASAIEFNTTKNMRTFKLEYFIRAVLPSLDAGLPCGLMIAGQYAGSHIVVCDGYGRHRTTGEIYVHLNVGYSGTDDGWFPLTENRAWRINGADYTDITGVVYNISPHFKGPIVSGHVVDKAGKAIAGATVTARREGVAITNVTTGARGQYNFKVLPGNYEVHVAQGGLERTVYLQLESCINSAYIQTGDYIMNVVDTRIGNKWGEDIVLDASAAQVAAPLSIPADGSTFTGSAYIELFSDTAGADIHYTTDGTYPTTSSTRYTEPFQITDSTTVHAIAFKDGMLSSALGTFSFVESTYGDVLNTPTTPWKSGGCARWYKDTVGLDTYASSTSTDTRDRLRSGVPATSQPKGSSSWLEATIDGPATVSFDYRYSTDYYSDFNVILDGATTNVHEHTYYTGNPEWKSVSSISIPAGEHKLRFEYYGTYKFDTTSTYGVYLRNMKIVYPNVLTGSVSSYANENWSTLLFSDGERNNKIWSQLSPTDAKVTLNGGNNRTVTVDIDAALHSLTLNNDVNLASDGTHKLTVGTVRVSGNTTLGVGALEVTGPISLTDLNASLTVPTGCDIVPKCGVSGAAVVETDVSGGKKYTLKAVYQSPFTATLSGSSVNWSNITFTDRNGNTANWATLNADAESKVSLNLTANATVTMNATAAIRNLQVAGEGTLTLAKSGGNSLAVSGATTANANVTVTSGSATLGAVALAGGKTLTIASTDAISSLTGAGTLVSSDNAWPTGKGLNDSGWTGTLKVTGGAMASDCDFNTVGNGGSKIEFAGAMASGGYLKAHQTFAGALQLDTTLVIAGGTAGSTYVFSGPLTGSGAFATSGSVPANSVETYCFTGDVSGFGGTFTVNGNHAVVFGDRAADDNALCGKILVPSGKSITIPAGKTWTAANGIEVSGELTVPSGATVSGGARLTDPAAKVTVKGGATATVACAVEHYELVTTPSGSDTVYTLRIAKLTYTGPFSVTLTESAVNWADIVWNDSGNLPGKWANLEAGDESVLTITANSDVTITMTADAKASKIITLGGGKVTLLYAGGLDVPAGMKTALQKPEWTGIVKLAGSRTFAGTELGEYGNANSSIELANNIGGYLKNNGRCEAALILDSGCLVTLNGGSAGYVYTFAGKLSGAGEFYFGGSTMCQFLCFTGDVTGFRGCINASYGRTVVYGEQAYNASSNNMVIVRSEVTAAANTASTVQGSVLVYGKLTLESGATIKQNWSTSAPVKLCALSAQVLVKSGCSIVPQSGITGQSLVTESVDGGTLYKFNYTPPTEPEPEDPNPPVVDPEEPEDPDEPVVPAVPTVSPIALWDGDFDEMKANVTFDRNENTLAQDGEYVQIARTGTTAGGARFVLASNIATSGVATVIFKVSDIPADEAFLISFHNKSTESSKANDPAGVFLTSALVPTQVNGGNRANVTGTALTSGLATRKLAMTWSTSGWQLYEIMDDAATQKFTCSGNHTMTFGGCTIGAAKAASSSNPIKSATGMKILSVALFDKMLTADELGAFKFASDSETDPDDPVTPPVVDPEEPDDPDEPDPQYEDGGCTDQTNGVLPEGATIRTAPLTKALWNQGRHYNRMAPLGISSNPDGRMYAGCVATAVSIILDHYQWPAYGTGTTYYDVNEASWPYNSIFMRARYDQTYDWENMRDTYGSVVSAEESMAVATLLADVGAAVGMEYGTAGSSTDSGKVPAVLKQHFFFDDNIWDITYPYSAEQEAAIQEQLSSGHPILCSSKNPQDAGHSYVCDGWAQKITGNVCKNYYHFNFGWGGTGNGWYQLGAVNIKSSAGGATTSWTVGRMFLRVLPQKAPQVLPRPGVTGVNGEIAWRIANCWTNALTGIKVERQEKHTVEVAKTFAEDDWLIDGEPYGWSVAGSVVSGQTFESWGSVYWPGWGSPKVVTKNGLNLSTGTSIELKYSARKFPAGVSLKLMKCIYDSGTSSYGIYEGMNECPTLKTLPGGSSTDALTEQTVTISGTEIVNAFGGAVSDVHLCFLFEDSNGNTTYSSGTEVFHLTSFKVTGTAEEWQTIDTVNYPASQRTHAYSGLAEKNHRFKVSAVYGDKSYAGAAEQLVSASQKVPGITASATGNKVAFTVSDADSFTYAFEKQINNLAGTHSKSGNVVTYTFASNDVATVGTHWLTLYVTNSTTKVGNKYVYITNPPTGDPLCDVETEDFAAAKAQAAAAGKMLLLVATGEADNTKFKNMSAVLSSNEVVTAASDKFVITEALFNSDEGKSLLAQYWKPQTVGDEISVIRAYLIVINPVTNEAVGQFDITSLAYMPTLTKNMATFLSRDFGTVTPVDPPDEPTEPFSLILAADANWEAAPWKGANDVAVPAERWSSAVQAAAIVAGENAGKLTLTQSLNLTALSVMGGTCAKPVVIADALGNAGFSTPITIAANSVLKLVASCTGALTVNSGATVVLTGSAAPASIANSGTVELAYASAKNFTDLKLSGAGLVRIVEGTVNAPLGSLTNDIEVASGATLNLTGELVAGQTYAITTGNLTLADSTSVTVGGIPLPEGWEVRDGIIAEKQDCMEVVWTGNSSTVDKTLSKPVVKGKPFTLIVNLTNTTDAAVGNYIIGKIDAGQTITPFCVAADEYTDFTTGGAIPNSSLSYAEKKSGGWWCGVGSRSNSGNATWSEEKIGGEVANLSNIYVAYSGTVADDGTVSDYVRMIYARKTSGEWYKLASTTASLAIGDDLDTMNINSSVGTLSVKAYLDYTQRNETQLISAIGEIDSNLPVGSCYYVVSINNNGSYTVPDGIDISKVRLVYDDGTPVANAKVDGRKITFDFVDTGSQCWWDYELDGNGNNTGTDGTALSWDGDRPGGGNSDFANDNTALYAHARPWRNVSSWPAVSTFVIYGKMVAKSKAYQLAFGSKNGGGNQLFLANEDGNMVSLCFSKAGAAPDVLCHMKVANAQACNHLYAFVLKTVNGHSVVNTYLDGEMLQPYEFDSTVSLGAGFQIASGHGGVATGYSRPDDTDPATIEWLRVYDAELTPAVMRRLAEKYPYESPNGNYLRELASEVSDWTTDDKASWKGGESSTTNEPAAQASVKLTSENGSTVRVNLAEDVEYETLTIGGGDGSGKIVITNGTGSTGKVVVTGRVIVNADAVIDLGAVELKGTPITVAEGKHLTIDTTSYVIDDYLQDTKVNLTGAVATNAGAVVETALPEDAEGRTVEVAANASTSQYEMQVKVNPAEVKLALAVDDDQDVAFGGERHLDIPLDWTLQLTNTEALAHGQITKPNVAAALSSTAKIPNGIKPWESYVLSLLPTNAVSKPVPIPVQTAKPDFLCFKLGNVKVRDEVKDGLDVTYRVKTFASLGAAEPESVSESSNHTETIGVDMPESGVRYYRLEVDIAPRNNQHVDK